MRKAMHFPGADAVEGRQLQSAGSGGRSRGSRSQAPGGPAVVIGQDKAEAKTGKRPDPSEIKVEEVAKELRRTSRSNFGKDKLAREMLVGIIEKPGGNPLATIEFAIKHESKELIIAQFKRMDRAEVEQLVKDHRQGPPGREGSRPDTGHQRLPLELAQLGTARSSPATTPARSRSPGWLFRKIPSERAEVALRVMDQQIDQSALARTEARRRGI